MKKSSKIILALLVALTIPYGYLVYKNRKPAPYVEQIPAYPMPESNPEQVEKVIADLRNKPAPFKVQQTVELVSMLYNELGPRMGSHLLEPNALLTFAGFRGQGNFLTHYLTQEEKIRFEQINNQLKSMGIKLKIDDDIEDEIVNIAIYNLKGFEYASGISKFPFVKRFDAYTGFDGLIDWRQNIITKGAEEYFKDWESKTSSLGNALSHLLMGLSLGYPDQAVLDMYDYIATNDTDRWPFIDSQIPDSNYYDNPQPNFNFLPEHKNDPGIVDTIKTWGNFLQSFYKSSWPQKLQNDSEFKQMRKLEDEMHDRWFKRKRPRK